MPFDSVGFEPFAPAPVETVERQRVRQLRDFLAELEPEKFDMSDYLVGPGRLYGLPVKEALNTCGTAACIAGWAQYLFDPDKFQDVDLATERLGLTYEQGGALFLPPIPSDPSYTKERAVAVLDHYLATGEIDWSVA